MLSGVYGRAARFRRAWYRRHPQYVRRLTRPVISLGNLVVGGSGKTPLVATIARQLIAAGERPAILSRGYGRRRTVDGVVVVCDGRGPRVPAAESGDEPQMLARWLPGVPVLVAADRYLAGALAERRFDCTVHILDDGFQHVQLARDVNLLVMASDDLRESVLPMGRLREPLETAREADALLVTGDERDAETVSAAVGVRPVFRVQTIHGEPRLILKPDAPPAGRRAVAVAGIARPARFFRALRDGGWEVTQEIVFRDHHWFTERDLKSIERAATETRADAIVTTEKDAVRLEADDVAASAVPWAVVPQQAFIEPAELFLSWLTERVRGSGVIFRGHPHLGEGVLEK